MLTKLINETITHQNMKNKETIIYNDFGFPITLVDVPIKMVMGEEILDIDMYKLQVSVLRYLIFKPTPLSGPQIHFIRKFLKLSSKEFAQKLGLTHPTILSWEKEQATIPTTADMCIRIEVLKAIQGDEIITFVNRVTTESLATHKEEKEDIIQIDQM